MGSLFSDIVDHSDNDTVLNRCIIICEPYLSNLVLKLLKNGVEKKAKGEDAKKYFNTAEIIAAAFSNKIENRSLYETVINYKKFTRKNSENKLCAHNLLDKGTDLYKNNEWNEALEQWYMALKTFEELKDLPMMSKIYGNIGVVYARQGRYKDGISYLLKKPL